MLIKTNQLQAGMVLAEDLKDHENRKLYPAGKVLTEKCIFNLKAWGILEVQIQGNTPEDKKSTPRNTIDPVKWGRAEKAAKKLFTHANLDHPAMAELMRLCAIKKIN